MREEEKEFNDQIGPGEIPENIETKEKEEA